jgi:WD40 repeat protein
VRPALRMWLFGDMLLPAIRSLRWASGQEAVFEGSGPLVVLPDGRVAYARGHDVCVLDRYERSPPVVLEGHAGWVNALAVLPHGRLASRSGDGTVRLWDRGTAWQPTEEGRSRCGTLQGDLSADSRSVRSAGRRQDGAARVALARGRSRHLAAGSAAPAWCDADRSLSSVPSDQ